MRSGNPALKSSTFLDAASGSVIAHDGGAMTLNGTVNKTGLLMLLTLLTAAFGWSQTFAVDGSINPRPPTCICGAVRSADWCWR